MRNVYNFNIYIYQFACFSQEMYGCVKEIHKKMDILLDLSEHLAPTLDMNDKATLKESIVSLNQKVSDVTAAAEMWQKRLEETIVTWKQYQVRCC